MPETKTKVMHEGRLVDAMDVPISSSNEFWSEYSLEDGTKLRVKFTVGSIFRLIDQYDPEGNPVYVVKGPIVSLPLVPSNLRKTS